MADSCPEWYTGGRDFTECRPQYEEMEDETVFGKYTINDSRTNLTMINRNRNKNQATATASSRIEYLWDGKWLTSQEIGEVCGITPSTLYQAYISGGKVGGYHVEGKRKIEVRK